MSPKIAFIFLIYDKINQERIWYDFFKDINPELYSIYIHYKIEMPQQPLLFFEKFKLNNCIQTKWGEVSLVKAQNLAIKEALKDPLNKKFITVSGACIPIKNFNQIYKKIIENENSYFNESIARNNLARNSPLFEKIIPFKASQWMILSRKHAIYCTLSDKLVDLFIKVPIFADEYFYITLLKNHPIFSSEIINYPVTNTKWNIKNKMHPIEHIDISQSSLNEIFLSESFFARKFNQNCKVGQIDLYSYVNLSTIH